MFEKLNMHLKLQCVKPGYENPPFSIWCEGIRTDEDGSRHWVTYSKFGLGKITYPLQDFRSVSR